jgi:hypothetical protein
VSALSSVDRKAALLRLASRFPIGALLRGAVMTLGCEGVVADQGPTSGTSNLPPARSACRGAVA